jgi:hypothetical protein
MKQSVLKDCILIYGLELLRIHKMWKASEHRQYTHLSFLCRETSFDQKRELEKSASRSRIPI